MRRTITTEEDLARYNANMRKIKVGGSGDEPVGNPIAGRATQGRASSRKPASGLAPSPQSDKPKYKSKWEESYSAKLELEKRAGLITAYWHEPFSLWLPGKVRYKPDFLVEYAPQPVYPAHICAIPKLEIIEVKGFSKNRRDGITRLKIAAALFPCFVWRMVYRTTGGGWDGHYL